MEEYKQRIPAIRIAGHFRKTGHSHEVIYMTRDDWLISIENSAAIVAGSLGQEIVDFILQKYDAESIEELNPYDYEAVFGELFQYEADLKD